MGKDAWEGKRACVPFEKWSNSEVGASPWIAFEGFAHWPAQDGFSNSFHDWSVGSTRGQGVWYWGVGLSFLLTVKPVTEELNSLVWSLFLYTSEKMTQWIEMQLFLLFFWYCNICLYATFCLECSAIVMCIFVLQLYIFINIYIHVNFF